MEPSREDWEEESAQLIPHNLYNEKTAPTLKPSRRHIALSRTSIVTLIIVTIFLSVLISSLGLHFLHIFNPRSQFTSGTRFGSCGNTTESARQANCTWDVMSFSWHPPACADPELTAEFLQLRNWTWWLDTEGLYPVPFEQVAAAAYRQLYVTNEFHMYHCTFMWRKMHRGLLRGRANKERRGVVDTYIADFGHTEHCERMLLGLGPGHDRNVRDTAIVTSFTQCMWV